MRVITFLQDIQDIWLLNSFLRAGSEVIYAKSVKITSPHLFLDVLENKNYSLHEFKGVDDQKFNHLLKNCDHFLTKECLPFLGENPYAEKTYSIGWCGESGTYDTKVEIRDRYRFHFVESQYKPLYDRLGLENIIYNSPKYYFLNGKNRRDICDLLGLDSNRRYMTFFDSSMGDIKGARALVEKIRERWLEVNGEELVLIHKRKMKHKKRNIRDEEGISGISRTMDSFGTTIFYDGNNFARGIFYHEGLMLQFVSEICISLPSSSVVESEVLDEKIISIWNHPKLKGEELYQDVLRGGKGYRMAQSPNTFRVYPEDTEVDLRQFLANFKKKSFDHTKQFEVHPLLEKLVK